jgi:hypothetical protein
MPGREFQYQKDVLERAFFSSHARIGNVNQLHLCRPSSCLFWCWQQRENTGLHPLVQLLLEARDLLLEKLGLGACLAQLLLENALGNGHGAAAAHGQVHDPVFELSCEEHTTSSSALTSRDGRRPSPESLSLLLLLLAVAAVVQRQRQRE